MSKTNNKNTTKSALFKSILLLLIVSMFLMFAIRYVIFLNNHTSSEDYGITYENYEYELKKEDDNLSKVYNIPKDGDSLHFTKVENDERETYMLSYKIIDINKFIIFLNDNYFAPINLNKSSKDNIFLTIYMKGTTNTGVEFKVGPESSSHEGITVTLTFLMTIFSVIGVFYCILIGFFMFGGLNDDEETENVENNTEDK